MCRWANWDDMIAIDLFKKKNPPNLQNQNKNDTTIHETRSMKVCTWKEMYGVNLDHSFSFMYTFMDRVSSTVPILKPKSF